MSCERRIDGGALEFICPETPIMENIDLDNITDSILSSIVSLQVKGTHDRGPLSSIPANICSLQQLKVNIDKEKYCFHLSIFQNLVFEFIKEPNK